MPRTCCVFKVVVDNIMGVTGGIWSDRTSTSSTPPREHQAAISSSRVSFLVSWPASVVHPTASVGAVSFSSRTTPAAEEGGQLCLLRARRNTEVTHFKRFIIHNSVPSLLRPVWFPSTAAPNPVGTGSPAIQHGAPAGAIIGFRFWQHISHSRSDIHLMPRGKRLDPAVLQAALEGLSPPPCLPLVPGGGEPLVKSMSYAGLPPCRRRSRSRPQDLTLSLAIRVKSGSRQDGRSAHPDG
jgi:hypothetical protein